MADPAQIDIRRLASLLDDPDDAVAISAMAELLNREDELGDLPGQLQEEANPLMRRRVHQLQSALTMIRRRRRLSALLRSDEIDFSDALIQIHLQWFDSDSESSLRKGVSRFFRELAQRPSSNLAEIGDSFAAGSISALPATTLKPEQYCIGVMVDDRCGASALWCGIICNFYKEHKFRVVRFQGRFAVEGKEGILIPEDNWRLSPLPRKEELEYWPLKNLLQLAVITLFSAAVNSDSFRYVLTLSQTFTGTESSEALGTLPYPYNPELEELS